MKRKITVLAAVLFLFTYFTPKTIYADVWFSPDCGHPGGQDQNCICVRKVCPSGDTENACFPDTGPTTPEKMQQIENMVVCSNPPTSSVPNNPPGQKPSCPYPGTSVEGVAGIDCAMQWAEYNQDLAQQQKTTPTPTATPTPTIYVPLPTFTPTPTPTLIPTPTIKHSTQMQKQTNHNNNFANSLLQNVGKFFGTITKFLINLTGRR